MACQQKYKRHVRNSFLRQFFPCHMTKRCNAFVVIDVASPVWEDEN